VSRKWDEFERQLGAWGGRSPTTPADAAGRRLASRLSPRRRGPFGRALWLRLAAAAVVMLAAVATIRHFSPPRTPSGGEPLPAGFQKAGDDVVVWIVDPHTTVIFALGPGSPVKGSGS
jgi:hypothetical protein